MKFTSLLSTILLAVSLSNAAPHLARRDVDPNLVPQFGVNRGVNPTGTGDCDGINGKKIPCACPPDRNDFIKAVSANAAAGHAVNNPGVATPFPTDNSQQSAITRMQTAIVTLQNLNGPGKGCPAVSTTFSAQLDALIKGQASPAAAPPPAAPAPPPPPPAAPAPPSGGVDPNLVPQFGVQRGVNPTGTGDCDGINGKKIPCACPPDRNDFINAVSANAAAGHAANNPGIATPFPTDNSQQSAIIRMQTAIVTLQNLNGPGKGCPAVSTTFSAQLDALIKGQPAPAPAPPPAAPAPPPPPPPAAPPAAPPASNGGGVDPNLVPQFGFQAGLNPTGTGDCDGINGVKIPCSCPPDRDAFIKAVSANAAAGHAVNNPGVATPFPTDNSKQSQITRLQTAIVTLQNLNGPGKGCPAVSTTFSAQLKALTG